MIAAITFDYWNTLYRASAYARPLRMRFLTDLLAKNRIVAPPGQLEAAEELARNEWNRVWREEHRTLNASDWLRVMFAATTIELPADDFQALAEYLDRSILEADPGPTLLDGVADTVRRLSPHYRLGIISDSGLSSGRTLREFLRRDNLLDYFACATFSDELGVSKPDPRTFLSTLACLDASPVEAVHLGDLTRSDVAGAKSVGMRAVRLAVDYDDPDRSVAPDAVVYSYAEFERWLSATNRKRTTLANRP